MNAPSEPEFLYRYRHLQGAHREYTSKILNDSLLYFASPRDFSDPFDCKVHFVLRAPKAALRQKYDGLVRARRPELNRKQRRARVSEDVRRVGRSAFVKGVDGQHTGEDEPPWRPGKGAIRRVFDGLPGSRSGSRLVRPPGGRAGIRRRMANHRPRNGPWAERRFQRNFWAA